MARCNLIGEKVEKDPLTPTLFKTGYTKVRFMLLTINNIVY